MKHLRRFSILLMLAFAGATVYAQCTPSMNAPSQPGIYPDTLADGEVGVPYDRTVDIVFFTDTSVVFLGTPIAFCIRRFLVEDIEGLPAGLQYECDNPGCQWIIDHSPNAVNRGCIRVYGTPTEAVPNDTVEVVVKVRPGSPTMGGCDTLVLPPFIPPALIEPFLTNYFTTKFRITGGTSSLYEPLTAASLKMAAFPNPATRSAALRFSLPRAMQAEVSLVDMTGRTVRTAFNGRLQAGQQELSLFQDGLPSGIYVVRMQLDGQQTISTRLTVME